MLFFIKKILFLISILSLFYSQEETFTKTELYNIYGNKYLSIVEYANEQKIPLKFYTEKNKLEFQLDNFKFLISPHSSFVKVKVILSFDLFWKNIFSSALTVPGIVMMITNINE